MLKINFIPVKIGIIPLETPVQNISLFQDIKINYSKSNSGLDRF